MVWNADSEQCVHEDECYCVHDGEQMEPGANWIEGICQNCTCESGVKECNEVNV